MKPIAPTIKELTDAPEAEAPSKPEQSLASKLRLKMLFVYGTLKKGHSLHSWIEGQQYVGKAEVNNACLIDAGPYPIMVAPVKDASVVGELYLVDEDLFKALSDMEHRAGYKTITVKAKVVQGVAITGSEVAASCYVFPTHTGTAQWEKISIGADPYVGVVSPIIND